MPTVHGGDWPEVSLWLDPLGSDSAGRSPEELARLAVALEESGFTQLWLSDPPAADPDDGSLGDPIPWEPFVVAGALATASRRLGLGVVPGADRRPAVLAKLATTLDVLTEGRAAVAVRLEAERADGWDRALEAAQVCRAVLEDDRPSF
ncbi:MAG: LLM class flavin-dependent oxidoreductase, partial [Acidimicrobiales bacterium]|nr:LLM class flavin-dependent oxidoreductase [Acidimicrobiales bacterium]